MLLAVVPFYLALTNYRCAKHNLAMQSEGSENRNTYFSFAREEFKEEKIRQAMYFPVFFLKRLLISFIAIGGRSFPYTQLTCLLITNMASLAFAVFSQPFKDYKSNVVLMIEEGSLLFIYLQLYFV